MSAEDCTTCRFARIEFMDTGDPDLKCHRYPPTIFVLDGEPTAATISVDEHHWCGEWGAVRDE